MAHIEEIEPIHLRNKNKTAEYIPHAHIISVIAAGYRPNLFIEYGVSNGGATKVFSKYCGKVFGVDIVVPKNLDLPNFTFFHMTTREFKKNVLDTLDEDVEMAFIDADHKWEEAFQDFEDLFPHLIENGIIFIHDTFPCLKKWIDPRYCNDSWIVPHKIKEKYGHLCDVLTIPIQPGLTMVRKCAKEIEHMQYSKLKKD